MKEIVKRLPAYDYVYLGDNARAPYGNRSFDTVYRYTLECVKWFFEQGLSAGDSGLQYCIRKGTSNYSAERSAKS